VCVCVCVCGCNDFGCLCFWRNVSMGVVRTLTYIRPQVICMNACSSSTLKYMCIHIHIYVYKCTIHAQMEKCGLLLSTCCHAEAKGVRTNEGVHARLPHSDVCSSESVLLDIRSSQLRRQTQQENTRQTSLSCGYRHISCAYARMREGALT
jgi:hypothetical protein